MKISLVQSSIEWLNPAANRVAAEQWTERAEGSALTLFAEMFSTGFCGNPKESSVESERTIEWLVEMAQKYQMAVGGSIAVESGGSYYNRFYIADKDGGLTHYDKRHLFTFAGEHHRYTAGEERVVVTVEGVRILLQICYDLRFPVFSRNRGDYDMIAYVAAWPAARRTAWDALLRARAIENLCYVGAVNLVGSDPNCSYSGGTAAIDFMGNILEAVEDNQKGIATLDIDLQALREFRERFPALDDRDDFEII